MYRKALTSDSLSGRMVCFGQKLPIIPSRLGRRLGLSPPHTERVVRRRAAQSSAASARSAALAFGATAAACGLSGVGPTGRTRIGRLHISVVAGRRYPLPVPAPCWHTLEWF